MRALLSVVLLLALTGSAAASDSPLFRRANGSAIVFSGTVRAWCDAKRLSVFSLAAKLRQSRWQLQIARKHLHPGGVVRFSWRHANGIGIFVYDVHLDGGNDLSAPIPFFFAQPFITGVDVALPAAPGGRGTVPVVAKRRGDRHVDYLGVPNWPSSTDSISLQFNDGE